ncbi:MAG: HAD family hydrolase [Clostridia bacterium]|nr:HAD family hydrolase [Clostridia bacterium]
MRDCIVWDFNGTLLDDMEAGFASINILLKRHGLPQLATQEIYRNYFSFPIKEYYRAVGFDVEGDGFDRLAREWVPLYRAEMLNPQPRRGAIEAVEALAQRRLKQIVLSASERSLLLGQLEQIGLSGAFDEVLGLDNIYAHSKTEIGRAWRAKNPEGRLLMIGDTLHDVEVASEIGAECILIAGGHQSRMRLAQAGVPIVDDFAALIVWIDQWQSGC